MLVSGLLGDLRPLKVMGGFSYECKSLKVAKEFFLESSLTRIWLCDSFSRV